MAEKASAAHCFCTVPVTFDQSLFQNNLRTQTFGRPLHWFETLPSTSTQLWELVRQGAAPGTAVIAAQQQAGRGQWGRSWSSPPGGLYLSVALLNRQSNAVPRTAVPDAIAPLSADQTPQLTVCSAWGVASALRNLDIPVTLKWPNDLLLHGKKLGGILTETTVQKNQITAAILGIGLNWTNPVPETGITLTSVLQDCAQITCLEQLAALMLQGLENGYQRWQTAGIEALLPDYLHLVTAWQASQTTMRLSDTLILSLKSLP
ncbi:Bifunctional ligase/repressor BirA [Acaryochloris thomasi RCC1774]|uniref:Bifunctional ligase/repressor BirA n=1 Tax=Acaryochloris thomasi RCC1774 TaxID=1764569 RepID=A0A2W1JF87_9CYAN|nr:biotin--[acetyl-CoA-carboxylase] ligase [Acaryochloris thomasi]PZD72278.1 Bifunctional ligase/repressor BirA [Acaryochloris thomasi RCC1774]